MSAERLQQARHLLAGQGLVVTADAAGLNQELLAIRAGLEDFERLRGLANELKALGFSYITLELDTED